MNLKINKNKKYVNIEFPAIVQNLDKCFRCLGGEENILKVLKKNERLACHLRPDEFYSKPLHSNKCNVTQLVMKIKRRKKGDSYEYKAEISGVLLVSYMFQGLCDFQYLPMVHNPKDETYTSLIDDLYINERKPSDWLKLPAKSFTPPVLFARIDFVKPYSFRDKLTDNDPSQEIRRRTMMGSIYIYQGDEIPHKNPNEFPMMAFYEGVLKDLRKMFEDEPLIRRVSLQNTGKFNNSQLKVCLPQVTLDLEEVAYTYISGPFRTCWVRFGYDPSKSFASKIYQVLDYRYRIANERVFKPGDGKDIEKPLPRRIRNEITKNELIPDYESNVDYMNQIKYIPSILPLNLHNFYLFKNIEIPEVQELVNSITEQEAEFDDKFGWLNEKIYDKCRILITDSINKLISERKEKGLESTSMES